MRLSRQVRNKIFAALALLLLTVWSTADISAQTPGSTRLAGLVRVYKPAGYRTAHAIVPLGVSVVLTAPAAFRFTYTASPERHLRAAELMGVPVRDLSDTERREALPRALTSLMRDVGIPNGIKAVGYTERDLPALIDGTLKQPRLLAGAPRTIGERELHVILHDAMEIW